MGKPLREASDLTAPVAEARANIHSGGFRQQNSDQWWRLRQAEFQLRSRKNYNCQNSSATEWLVSGGDRVSKRRGSHGLTSCMGRG